MLGVEHGHGIATLVVVAAARDAEELAPIVNRRGAVGVHRAVNHDGGFAGLVGGGDFADVGGVSGVGEALVVHDDVVGLGPVRIVVERNLRRGALAALVDDGPRDVAKFLRALEVGLGLEIVVVAAAAGDEQRAHGLGGAEAEKRCGEKREEKDEAGFHGERAGQSFLAAFFFFFFAGASALGFAICGLASGWAASNARRRATTSGCSAARFFRSNGSAM